MANEKVTKCSRIQRTFFFLVIFVIEFQMNARVVRFYVANKGSFSHVFSDFIEL